MKGWVSAAGSSPGNSFLIEKMIKCLILALRNVRVSLQHGMAAEHLLQNPVRSARLRFRYETKVLNKADTGTKDCELGLGRLILLELRKLFQKSKSPSGISKPSSDQLIF